MVYNRNSSNWVSYLALAKHNWIQIKITFDNIRIFVLLFEHSKGEYFLTTTFHERKFFYWYHKCFFITFSLNIKRNNHYMLNKTCVPRTVKKTSNAWHKSHGRPVIKKWGCPSKEAGCLKYRPASVEVLYNLYVSARKQTVYILNFIKADICPSKVRIYICIRTWNYPFYYLFLQTIPKLVNFITNNLRKDEKVFRVKEV